MDNLDWLDSFESKESRMQKQIGYFLHFTAKSWKESISRSCETPNFKFDDLTIREWRNDLFTSFWAELFHFQNRYFCKVIQEIVKQLFTFVSYLKHVKKYSERGQSIHISQLI